MDIGTILKRIVEIINTNLQVGDQGIQLRNISFVASENQNEGAFMSVVNIEEEKSLRYSQTKTVRYPDNSSRPEIHVHNPVVFLNLYILFSFHRGGDQNYDLALNHLGGLTRFLQKKYVFTAEDITLPNIETKPAFQKVVFELYSLSFEQMNHLWGVLGGKYIPSVVYKVRLFPIKAELPNLPEALVKRERANLNHI